MNALFAVLIVLFQFPTPSFPDVPTVTPFATPTDMVVIEGTPVDLNTDDLENSLSGAQDALNALPTTIAVRNNQFYYNGRPLLPSTESTAQLFSYSKWLTGTTSYSFFGPFHPIMLHIGFLILLAVVSLVMYYGQMLFNLLMRFASWVIRLIRKFLPF